MRYSSFPVGEPVEKVYLLKLFDNIKTGAMLFRLINATFSIYFTVFFCTFVLLTCTFDVFEI